MATRLKSRMGDELERLIKAIGDCKAKSEEDRILFRAIESTKASVKSGKADKQRTKDFLIKLLYFEMLGHDASFGHFLAVQACGSSSIMTKLVGYLAVSQFLDSSDSLILLLVNTWMSDLQNDNHLIAVCKLVNGDAIGALVPQVVNLTSHSKEGVRKKAVMALHRFCQIDPQFEGGMSGVDISGIFRRTLCDKDPSVMAATLCGLYELAKEDPYPYRNLIPSLTTIVKQVIEHRLSKAYEYHHCPAPFIQIRVLRILSLLGEGDKPSTDNMRNVLLSVLKHANPRNTIGFAVLFECIRTMTTVSPDTTLLETAAKSIFTFLRSDNSHNLKYMGLDALGGLVSINFRQAQEHQTAVMDCLEDPDDTLKLKTLELLYKMTKASNVEIVVEKLIQYLHTCSDEHVMKDICQRVSDLAERYAPSTLWYVETMIEMFEAAGDAVPSSSSHNLMKLIAEQEEDLHKAVVDICLALVEKPKLPQNLLQVICWVLGEYGTLVERYPDSNATLVSVQEKMCDLIQISNPDEDLQGYILSALLKLSASNSGSIAIEAEDLIRKSLMSKSTDLQQRALELQAFEDGSESIAAAALPFDASCEDLGEELSKIQALSFLDTYVADALQNGAAAYIPETERDEFGVSLAQAEPDIPSVGLRYDAYQTPNASAAATSALPVGVETVTSGMPEAPPELPVAVSSFATPSEPSLALPTASRRWGPPQPEVTEPPVFRIDTMKVEYSRPDERKPDAVIEEERKNGTAEVTERDVLKASLFGDSSSTRAATRSKFVDKSGQKSAKPKPKAASPVKKQTSMPEIDLLDLSDAQDTTAAAAPPPPTDPFAGVDLLSGMNGTDSSSATQPTSVSPPVAPQALDLDALYGLPQPNIMTTFPPMHTTPAAAPPAVGPHPMAPGFGLKTGMANSMPNLNKPAVSKDDPFKDLLG